MPIKYKGLRFKVRGVTFIEDVQSKFFYLYRMVGAWNVLPGVFVEEDTIVILKTFFVGTCECRKCRDMDQVPAEGIRFGMMFSTGFVGQRVSSCAALFCAL